MPRSSTGSRTRPGKRPELAGVFSTFSARVPQLKFDLDRTKARRLDVPVSDVFAVLQANLGGYYVNDFDLYGKVWKVMVQAEGGVRNRPEDIESLYVLNRKGNRVPLELPGRGPLRPGADRRAALQPLRRRQDQRRARARLQLGPGARRDGGGRRRGPARGVRLRVDRHHLPGAEDRQPGGLHLRPLGRLRLPVHGGPVRELDPAARHHPDGARWRCSAPCVGLWLYDMPLDVFGQIGLVMLIGLETKNAILIVEFGVEMHREARDEHPRVGQGGVPRAAPADPDDLVRLRHGRPADGPGHRRRGVQPQLARRSSSPSGSPSAPSSAGS